ncbi:hypothetical protein KI387_032074, partial [Taxus chinensis]
WMFCHLKIVILYKSAHHCLEEVFNWSFDDDEHLVAVVIALQINSNGKFDNVSRTRIVRKLVNNFDTAERWAEQVGHRSVGHLGYTQT